MLARIASEDQKLKQKSNDFAASIFLNSPAQILRDINDQSELKMCLAESAQRQFRGDGEQPQSLIHHCQRDLKAEALALDLQF
jgi:hypothetical protein